MTDRIKVHLVNPCYECHEFFGNPSAVLKHLKSVHCIEIDGRQPSQKRPVTKAFTYPKDHTSDCVTHFACPSCWFHCSEDFDIFSRHVIECHVYPAANNGSRKNGNGLKMMEEEEPVNPEVMMEEPEPIIKKNKGKKSAAAGPSQEAVNEIQDALLGVLDELANNFKMLFNKREK